MNTKLVRPLLVACGCTAALAAAACGNSNSTANRETPSAAAAPAENPSKDNQPVTLTGCLMRGDGRNDFIMTKANEPVGTSGAASGSGSPESKTLEAASRSYRLDGDNDELEKLVGHQIRVTGTVVDKGDLDAAEKGSAERGTSGTVEKNREISQSDLAQVDVKSVESTADSCDNATKGARKGSKR